MGVRGYNCARNRRSERRAELKNAYSMNEQLKVSINGDTEETKRPTLSLARKPANRVEKAISIRSTKVYDSADNTCLPNSSIYSAKYRKSGTLLESGEVTARA